MTGEPGKTGRWAKSFPGGRVVALASGAWAALAALNLGLSIFAPRGVLGDRLLPPWACLTLACTELVALAVMVLLAAGLFFLLERALKKAPLLVAALARTGLAALLILAYAGSWASFWFTGQFLDDVGLEFCATNLAGFFGYVAGMHGLLLVVAPCIVGATACAATTLLPRWMRRCPISGLRRLTKYAAAALVVCAATALGGELAQRTVSGQATDPATGVTHSIRELYRIRRDSRTGPFTHAASNLIRRPGGPEGDEGPAIVRRPLVPMDAYLAGTDRTRLDRLNVIVILIDSLRADQLHAGGAARDVMPAVNALAAESRVFTDAYSQANHTDYATLCALSSHYPLRDPIVHRYPERPTYPRVLVYDVLKAAGWRTAVFSSQDERWGNMMNYLQTGSVDTFFHSACFDPAAYPEDAALAQGHGPQYVECSIDDRFTVSESIRWIDGAAGQPFFIYMNLQNAHAPYATPSDFPVRFGPAKPDFKIGFGAFPPSKAAAAMDVYANSLAYVDAQLDRLFRHLRQRGLWDRTLIVVTGDHGEAFHEHGFAAHGNQLYDESIRVPLVVRVPGRAQGRDPRPAQMIDIPPTVLGSVGLPPHPSFQGIDLFEPAPAGDRSRYVIVQTTLARQYAVIRSGHKLLFDALTDRYLLYDLENDPGERRDVADAKPERMRDLSSRLSAWYRAQLDYYEDRSRHAVEYPPILDE